MPQEIRRFYADIGRDGSRDPVVRRALAWLLGEARSLQVGEATLAVPTLGNLGFLSHIIDTSIEQLKRDKEFILATQDSATTVRVRIITERTLPASSLQGPVLFLWGDGAFVARVERLAPPAICVLPWVREEIQDWVATWDPTDILTGARHGEARTVSNPVVERALHTLQSSVNRSTGLDHPSDERLAVNVFEMLREHGEDFQPGEILSWATRKGWTDRGVEQLVKVATDVKEGRRRSSQPSMLRPEVIERWRADAQ